jgi:putative two-component system response regulator
VGNYEAAYGHRCQNPQGLGRRIYQARRNYIAQYHHKKWDGSGYPNNLKGIEIPIAGRIAAIADVFDALTSKRPYKEPFSVEKSLAIIREGRGSHFDPDVVDAFFAIQDEILTIKKQYGDDNQQAFDIPELKALLQHKLFGVHY